MSPPPWLPSSAHPVFTRVTTLTPGVGLMIGLAAVFFGAALWRFVSVGAGLAIGGWAGWQVGVWAQSPGVGWVGAAAVGVGFAVMFYLVERIAVASLGGAVAVEVTAWAWPLLRHVPPDLTVLSVAALVGFLVGALLHRRAIQALSALAGATLVAWALGYPGHPGLIAAVGLLGAGVQGRRGGAPKVAKAAKAGKKGRAP